MKMWYGEKNEHLKKGEKMPKRYDFTEKDFLEFKKKMLEDGFRQIQPYEFYTELRVADVTHHAPKPGREEGFIFFALGLEVRVWTSFVMSQGGVRTPDSGWVVIREAGVAQYYAPQMYRTKDFFIRMRTWARICREHIQARPVGRGCGNYMSIVRKKNGQCFWQCTNPIHRERGEKPPTESWDIGLSAESIAFVKKKRKKRAQYSAKRVKANLKPFGEARKNRKGWQKRNPPTAHAQ